MKSPGVLEGELRGMSWARQGGGFSMKGRWRKKLMLVGGCLAGRKLVV